MKAQKLNLVEKVSSTESEKNANLYSAPIKVEVLGSNRDHVTCKQGLEFLGGRTLVVGSGEGRAHLRGSKHYNFSRDLLIEFSVLPENYENLEVDHINGNPYDDRICNLRWATRVQNCASRGKTSLNTTGFKGVDIREGKFRAQILNKNCMFETRGYETARQAHGAYVLMSRALNKGFYNSGTTFPDEERSIGELNKVGGIRKIYACVRKPRK